MSKSSLWHRARAAKNELQAFYADHQVLLTVSGTLLSGTAAWAGFAYRQASTERIQKQLDDIRTRLDTKPGDSEHNSLMQALHFDRFVVPGAILTIFLTYGVGFRHGKAYERRKMAKTASEALGKKLSGAETIAVHPNPPKIGIVQRLQAKRSKPSAKSPN